MNIPHIAYAEELELGVYVYSFKSKSFEVILDIIPPENDEIIVETISGQMVFEHHELVEYFFSPPDVG